MTNLQNFSIYHNHRTSANSLLALLEADNLGGQLLRAVRQGFYFGIETRVPYAIGFYMCIFGRILGRASSHWVLQVSC